MSEVQGFEDLIAWQKARELTQQVYGVTRQGELAKDYGLSRQIQRASVSIMSNIAEGYERMGRAEFHQFLSTAKASCAEVRSLLYVALDAGYVERTRFETLMSLGREVANVVGGLRAAVQKQRDKQRQKG